MKFKLAVLALCALLLSCSTTTPPPPTLMPTNPPVPTETPAPTATPEPKAAFRVVGYITDWGVPVPDAQIEKLTHINYAFALPTKEGTINFPPNEWKLQQYVQVAHANGVKVLVSVGGWGLEKEFEAFAAVPERRAVFIKSLMDYIDKNQLDGADIDWEYPTGGESTAHFVSLMQELRVELDRRNKLLTAAVAAYGDNAKGIPNDTFALMDFVNVMAYADEGANHSPYELATRALDYWAQRGLAANKTVLGVPFYAMPGDVPYRKIVGSDLEYANRDTSRYLGGDVGYNGLPTIRAKTELALERANGIMIWTINDDALNDLSLLKAIQDTMASQGAAR